MNLIVIEILIQIQVLSSDLDLDQALSLGQNLFWTLQKQRVLRTPFRKKFIRMPPV